MEALTRSRDVSIGIEVRRDVYIKVQTNLVKIMSSRYLHRSGLMIEKIRSKGLIKTGTDYFHSHILTPIKFSRILFLSNLLDMETIHTIINVKLNRNPEFSFNSHKLKYFFHSYNNFGITERAIEIPVVQYYLESGNYHNILEIGNVTNHYYENFRHIFSNVRKTVVDKFEIGNGVINKDIIDYVPDRKFDFIFSISTFEHMDSDLGRNPDYIKNKSNLVSVAADNIKYVHDVLLDDGGVLIITAPLDYTPEWGATVFSDAFTKCGFARCEKFLFKRKSELAWEQVDIMEGKNVECTPHLARKYITIIKFTKNTSGDQVSHV